VMMPRRKLFVYRLNETLLVLISFVAIFLAYLVVSNKLTEDRPIDYGWYDHDDAVDTEEIGHHYDGVTGVAAPRSPHWATFRASFIKEAAKTGKDCCAACGVRHNPPFAVLALHHKESFHEHPEKELDYDNCIILCQEPNNCHLKIGHLGNFKKTNPNVVEDSRRMRANWNKPDAKRRE